MTSVTAWRQDHLKHRRDHPSGERLQAHGSDHLTNRRRLKKIPSSLRTLLLFIPGLLLLSFLALYFLSRTQEQRTLTESVPPSHLRQSSNLPIVGATLISVKPLLLALTFKNNASFLFIGQSTYHTFHSAFPLHTIPSISYNLHLDSIRPSLSSYRYRSIYRAFNYRTFTELPPDFHIEGSLCDANDYVELDAIQANRIEPYEWIVKISARSDEWWPIFLVKYVMTGQVLRRDDVGLLNGGPVLSWKTRLEEAGGGEVAWDILKVNIAGKNCIGGRAFWKRIKDIASRGGSSGGRAQRAIESFGITCDRK